MDLSTCTLALGEHWQSMITIALYAHLVPAALVVFLGFYTAIRSKFSGIAVAFLSFTLAVAIWLLNDLILWTVPQYYLVSFFWSWIDYANVVFFILGAFFYIRLARGTVPNTQKLLLLALSIPSFVFTATGNSVTAFDHSWCELLNNDKAVLYKQIVEWTTIFLMFHAFLVSRNLVDKSKRAALGVVLTALLLFLGTFSITEYFAAQTAIYEINLYGLFVLPVFLIVMVFAVTNLEIFKIRYVSTQVLVYVLIILVASQFLFLESSTDALLNGLTLALSLIIGIILLQNEKQELDSLLKIERLAEKLSAANTRLQELDRIKNQFLSFATHQLKTPLGAIRWQASMLADGTYGTVPPDALQASKDIEHAAAQMVQLVGEFLDLRKLQEGHMEYAFVRTDIAALVDESVASLRPLAEEKGLALTYAQDADRTFAVVDKQKFTQVVQNLIDNAIKYTDRGSVAVRLYNEGDTLVCAVKDTGHGIAPDVLPHLFEQFMRDRKDAKVIEGTGLGLYIAKQIMTAHAGDISVQSAGPGTGSTFSIRIATHRA